MILYSYNDAEIEYHSDLNILEIRWINILQEKQLNILWEEILINLIKFEIKFLLFDAPHLNYVPFLTTKHNFVIPHETNFSKALEKIAFIISDIDKNTHIDENIILSSATLLQFKFQYKFFLHHYEAVYWLLDSTTY